jgi:hypothetical protein
VDVVFCALLLPVLESLQPAAAAAAPLPPAFSSARTRAAFLADVASLLACDRFGSCTTDSPPRPTIFPSMLKACGGLVGGFATVELVAEAAAAAGTAAEAALVADADADDAESPPCLNQLFNP